MRSRIITVSALMVVTVALLAACGGTANTNTARMTNLGTNNANVGAVVVNSSTNAANANANRWNNSNVTREEYDKTRSEYEKDKGSSTIGTGVNDSWLWFKTRSALLATSDLQESTINVDVSDEVITLKGSVPTAVQKAKAEQVANGMEGKKKVVNQLTIAPGDSMMNTNRSSGNARTP